MPHIRDFEPTLPDPQPYVDKALALYKRAAADGRGRVVFIAAELGGGKTDHLSALAKGLRQAKPTPTFVAGYFSGGEYRPYTLAWQKNVCLSKAVAAAGETAALLGLCPGPFALAAGFVGQLLQTTVSAHELGAEFRNNPPPRSESADWLRTLLRRAAAESPLVCLLDNWDEAQRFFWDDMLLSFSREIAQGLPLLLFVTVKGPLDLREPEKDESGLARVVKMLTEEKGLAECWPLRRLSREEVAAFVGEAAPGVADKLHGVTGGNARWVRELWREWRLSEVVTPDESDRWVWGAQHRPTLNLYELILRHRLTRLLKAQTATEVEEARDVLACAALEGVRFTADAVARALGWDRDELIDFLDEKLVRTEENPDGLLLDEGFVNVAAPDGSAHTLCRYSFVSDLHWLILSRHGFTDERRPGTEDSERMEKSAALADALIETYADDERLAAAPLARLLHDLGDTEAAQHYQRLADYTADRLFMREHALHLLTVKKDDWGPLECARTAEFLIAAGNTMFDMFPHSETLAVFEEACKLARQVNDKHNEAHAQLNCCHTLFSTGLYKVARDRGNESLQIYRSIKYRHGTALALCSLSDIDCTEGHYADARERASQALKIWEELRYQSGVADALHVLARIAYYEGSYAEAREHALQALDINQKLGHQFNIVLELCGLAELDNEEGRYAEAKERASQALSVGREIGSLLGEASALDVLAKVEINEGNYAEAWRYALRSLDILQGLGERQILALTLHSLGRIARKYERPKGAVKLMAMSDVIVTQVGSVKLQIRQDELESVLGEQGYTEERRRELFRQVTEAYLKDGGREFIEDVLARLEEVD